MLTPEESEEEENEVDVDDPTGSQGSTSQRRKAGALTYKEAKHGIMMRPTEYMDLKTVKQLKSKGDKLQAQCEAEKREPFYQS